MHHHSLTRRVLSACRSAFRHAGGVAYWQWTEDYPGGPRSPSLSDLDAKVTMVVCPFPDGTACIGFMAGADGVLTVGADWSERRIFRELVSRMPMALRSERRGMRSAPAVAASLGLAVSFAR